MNLTLPTDSAERKEYPMFEGCLAYFPAALAGVSKHSKMGNDKHNPGELLHHARGKSMDHKDCIVRHLVDIGDIEARILRRAEADPKVVATLLDEANALAWRALALSQELHEGYSNAPLAPNARRPEKNLDPWDLTKQAGVDRFRDEWRKNQDEPLRSPDAHLTETFGPIAGQALPADKDNPCGDCAHLQSRVEQQPCRECSALGDGSYRTFNWRPKV